MSLETRRFSWAVGFIAVLFPFASCFGTELLFPETVRDNEGSAIFERLVSDPTNTCIRVEMMDHYLESGLLIEFDLFRRSMGALAEEHFEGSPSISEDLDTSYSVPCSFYSGIPRETERNLQSQIRRKASDLADNIRQSPCSERASAEKAINEIAFGCPLVAEWAYATLLCLIGQGDVAVSQDRESAFRSLIELETRGYLPRALATTSDLYFFLCQTMYAFGDLQTAIVLGDIALEEYPKSTRNLWINELEPTVPKDQMEDFVRGLRSVSPITEDVQ